jgi:hypothetical protein
MRNSHILSFASLHLMGATIGRVAVALMATLTKMKRALKVKVGAPHRNTDRHPAKGLGWDWVSRLVF